jgi:exodeoxyribonuclease-5
MPVRAPLTPHQKEIRDKLLEGVRRDVPRQTLGGYAGTGKSHLIADLLEALPGFAVCAPTGKAADVLRRKGVGDASTIHSLIYTPERQEDGSVLFVRKPECPCDGFLVDESSMVDEEVDADMLAFGRPIINVGDHGQLPPVQGKLNLMENPDYRLEELHRNAGEIAHFCEHLRLGRHSWEFQPEKKVVLLRPGQAKPSLAARADQVICAFNKTRLTINRMVREHLGYREPLVKGERVMCLRNDRDHGIFNGMQGIVEDYYRASGRPHLDLRVHGELLTRIPYDPDQFGRPETPKTWRRGDPALFDYAYGATAHKCQGDQFDRVLVLEQICSKWPHPRWAYTGGSRAVRLLGWSFPPPGRGGPAKPYNPHC